MSADKVIGDAIRDVYATNARLIEANATLSAAKIALEQAITDAEHAKRAAARALDELARMIENHGGEFIGREEAPVGDPG